MFIVIAESRTKGLVLVSLSLPSNEIKLLYSECVSSVLSLAMHLQRKLTTPRNDIFGFCDGSIACNNLLSALLSPSTSTVSGDPFLFCLPQRRNAHFSNCVTFLNYLPVQARYRRYEWVSLNSFTVQFSQSLKLLKLKKSILDVLGIV